MMIFLSVQWKRRETEHTQSLSWW